MDIEKFNSRQCKLLLYFLPFAFLLLTQLNYLLFMAKVLQTPSLVLFILLHLFFLLAAGILLTNVLLEILFTLFEDRKNSSLRTLLYGGRVFLPVRKILYVAVFIAAYIVLLQILTLRTTVQFLILILPTFAIAMNTRSFLSGRIRFINGRYLLYSERVRTVFSYSADENGRLIFLTDDGKILETAVTIADPAFKQLEAEFKTNNLHLHLQ
jgi:hypothetical protein